MRGTIPSLPNTSWRGAQLKGITLRLQRRQKIHSIQAQLVTLSHERSALEELTPKQITCNTLL